MAGVSGMGETSQQAPESSTRAGCRKPPHACRLQTSATPGSYQPLVSGIDARREAVNAPAHSQPQEQARPQRPSRERARKAWGRSDGRSHRGGAGRRERGCNVSGGGVQGLEFEKPGGRG